MTISNSSDGNSELSGIDSLELCYFILCVISCYFKVLQYINNYVIYVLFSLNCFF